MWNKSASEQCEESDAFEIASSMAGPGTLIYEICSDAMIGQGIRKGNFVSVNPQNQASHGDIIIAEFNGCITIKRFMKKEDRIELHASMEPIVVKETDVFRIKGIVVGSLRLYNRWKGKSST